MKYFWTLFWTFILIQMVVYVGSSMIGTEFDFNTGAILTIPVAVLLYIIPAIIPNDPVEKH
ncbi:YjzD family protein [Bacillus sp. T3]|uniref:YjzD family protein n=1 Tax=Bacillus sp. T3 TaxID=467262 RepID=UPI002980D5C4|nr:YjzD family protein [Bacillus sp. T3]